MRRKPIEAWAMVDVKGAVYATGRTKAGARQEYDWGRHAPGGVCFVRLVGHDSRVAAVVRAAKAVVREYLAEDAVSATTIGRLVKAVREGK